ncbi:MAG: hypothetical protein IPK75_19810 [Acidobacteria bacterium]|nr:hypothetical protein [Acidobacteriota bacterium]
MRNTADAEDIVQGAFLAARRAYPDKGVDELAPLLMTLVRNRMLDFLKSAEHKRQLSSVEIGEVSDQLMRTLAHARAADHGPPAPRPCR